MSQCGELIKKRRNELGITQSRLGELVNCQKTTISGWETGRRNVNSAYFTTLAKALKIDRQEFVRLSEGEEMTANKYIDEFMSIADREDAANFIDQMLIDFKVDAANEISLKFKLRNYALLTLLYCVSIKDKYTNPNDPYDIEVFIGELRDSAYNKLMRKEYAELGYMRFEYGGEYEEGTVTPIQLAAGELYDNVNFIISEDDMQFRIHLLDLTTHIRKLCYGEINPIDKYMLF